MGIVVENKFETIQVPVAYKNVFMKIVDNFSAKEIENKIFDNDNIFFTIEQENELISLDSYKNLKNTIKSTFLGK